MITGPTLAITTTIYGSRGLILGSLVASYVIIVTTLGPVLLTFLRHVARISANGIAAFKESCAPIG